MTHSAAIVPFSRTSDAARNAAADLAEEQLLEALQRLQVTATGCASSLARLHRAVLRASIRDGLTVVE
jgi:hypothetical protein